MTWLVLSLLTTPAPAKKPPDILSKNVHNGLHRALDEPEQPPPPVVYGEADLQSLADGETVFRYENLKGHDVGLAAATTWANRYEVWRAIKLLEQYPEYLEALNWAKLDDEKSVSDPKGDHDLLHASMQLALPGGVNANMKVEARHYQPLGFISYRTVDVKKNPFNHAMGYWSVTEIKDKKTLVQFMIDAKPAFPIPLAQRQWVAETTMPYLVSQMCRRAESETKKREQMHREEF